MKAKKLAKMSLMLTTVAAMLAACSTGDNTNAGNNAGSEGAAGNNGAASGEKLPVRYLLPGNAPEDLDTVVAAINEKMAADGVNLTYEPTYIPWDVWDQKTNLMMSTGEEFEMIAIMHDIKSPNVLVGNGGLVAIDELLDEYGADLKAAMPEWIWESAKVKGETYSVPNFWSDTAFNDGMITMRADLLAENGLQAPTSPAELLDVTETLKTNWPEDDKNVYIKMLEEPAYYLHRTYETYPFTVFENMVYIDQEGNVESWLETDEFKQDVDYAREAYERGLIHPDVLTVPDDVMNREELAGRYLYRQGDVGLGPEAMQRFPEAELDIYFLNSLEEQPRFRSYAVRNSNGISATSPHPEAAIQFLNWVYGSQENFDLVLYGVEGEHWEDAGDNLRETLKLGSNGGSAYELPMWLLGHVEMNRYPTSYDKERLERRTTIADPADVTNSVTIGFNFDPTQVSSEYANVVAEMKTSILPLMYGVVSYDKAFAGALSNMKAAGLDAVVAEYEKQFSEWQASQ
ncbi:extracellular solute-binding protein [Paenibacillus sp. IB182496]|uniref:Extracellular solute-binding protein n=1 Tax=Paenibacillus sabuli TaxID=2772509 RepID=A0A927BSI1_9BACL|nr:extracellular solute-binding protein [Paenibacillus sabuli]MBD2845967.1 extracellular solute-binding protein [Paenibacillus sabuli]